MTTADSLLLEAKQAILEEQHRRFRELQAEGRLDEALAQFRVTLACAADLLTHSVGLLQRVLAPPAPPDRPVPPGGLTP
jgi:hypothetical protein